MQIKLNIIVAILFIGLGFPQFGNLNLTLNADQILISDLNNQILWSKELTGKKISAQSQNQNYLLVTNYNFVDNESDIFIDVFLFNSEGKMIKSFNLKYYYDLPVPKLIVLNNGDVLELDNIYMVLNFHRLIGDNIISFKLEDNYQFEYEKQVFSAYNENYMYILLNTTKPNLADDEIKCRLYKVDLNTYSENVKVEKMDLDIEIVSSFNLSGSGIEVESYDKNTQSLLQTTIDF